MGYFCYMVGVCCFTQEKCRSSCCNALKGTCFEWTKVGSKSRFCLTKSWQKCSQGNQFQFITIWRVCFLLLWCSKPAKRPAKQRWSGGGGVLGPARRRRTARSPQRVPVRRRRPEVSRKWESVGANALRGGHGLGGRHCANAGHRRAAAALERAPSSWRRPHDQRSGRIWRDSRHRRPGDQCDGTLWSPIVHLRLWERFHANASL